MECMVFVVNLQNQHWLAIAVFPKLLKIEVFDPMGSADLEACYAIWFFLVECYYRNSKQMLTPSEWKLFYGRDS